APPARTNVGTTVESPPSDGRYRPCWFRSPTASRRSGTTRTTAMRFPATLLAALLALTSCGAATSESETAPSSSTSESMMTPPEPGTDPPTTAADGARVVEVVDGDTIRIELDGEQERVRLIGINA